MVVLLKIVMSLFQVNSLSKKDTQMANKDMKRCLISFAFRELQIKITMKYHFTSSRMGITKKPKQKKSHKKQQQKRTRTVSAKIWKTGVLIIAGGNLKWCSCLENGLAVPQNVTHSYILIQRIEEDSPLVCLLGIFLLLTAFRFYYDFLLPC